MLPNEHHIARICPKATLANDCPSASSFAPHPGNQNRPPDEALSVHWLELLHAEGTHAERLVKLREFLVSSPVPGEFKPSATSRLAVLAVGPLHVESEPQFGTSFSCHHSPRLAAVDDPHSEVHTSPEILAWPADESFRLAVQQFLCDNVIYHELGRL